MSEVDLEALAAGYGHRRVSGVSLERAREAGRAAGLGPGALAVDVGGGRGDHAVEFARSGALSVVVDRSQAMAAAARAAGVSALIGDAGALPLMGACADLVFFHLSIHYGDWRRSLSEAVRITRPGGHVEVWTFTHGHLTGSFLTQWFPSVASIDLERFPDPADLVVEMRALGLQGAAAEEAPETVHGTAGEWRTGVEGGFVSTLQLLPPGEMRTGLARFDAAHPDPAERLEYDLGYVRVSGSLPG